MLQARIAARVAACALCARRRAPHLRRLRPVAVWHACREGGHCVDAPETMVHRCLDALQQRLVAFRRQQRVGLDGSAVRAAQHGGARGLQRIQQAQQPRAQRGSCRRNSGCVGRGRAQQLRRARAAKKTGRQVFVCGAEPQRGAQNLVREAEASLLVRRPPNVVRLHRAERLAVAQARGAGARPAAARARRQSRRGGVQRADARQQARQRRPRARGERAQRQRRRPAGHHARQQRAGAVSNNSPPRQRPWDF